MAAILFIMGPEQHFLTTSVWTWCSVCFLFIEIICIDNTHWWSSSFCTTVFLSGSRAVMGDELHTYWRSAISSLSGHTVEAQRSYQLCENVTMRLFIMRKCATRGVHRRDLDLTPCHPVSYLQVRRSQALCSRWYLFHQLTWSSAALELLSRCVWWGRTRWHVVEKFIKPFLIPNKTYQICN